MDDTTDSLNWSTAASEHDASVNHFSPTPDNGLWEARWVQRVQEYGIVYVSSHTGCSLSCRFCHLTATGQTMMQPARPADYMHQLQRVLGTYHDRVAAGMAPIDRLHINFMARGEALANPHVLNTPDDVFGPMGAHVRDHVGVPVQFLVSSILPRTLTHDLVDVLADERCALYYSLYSMDPAFRKRWLPKALPPEVGLDLCADFQRRTGRRINLHWAFIAGHNDRDEDVDAIVEAVQSRGITGKFNLVRYNPHDQRHGVEPDETRLQALFDRMSQGLGGTGSRIVPRVGYDVKASCGMFIDPNAHQA